MGKFHDHSRVDPTFKKYESAGQIVIQILLAAASGDILSLRRAWLQVRGSIVELHLEEMYMKTSSLLAGH